VGGGWFAPLPSVSYAADQVHFKHEQPQVLLIKSHVTIGTIQQTQDAASVFEYIDIIFGMRLDQTSYWYSWKLVGRLWRYHHEIWL